MYLFGFDIRRAKKKGNVRKRLRRGFDAAKIDRLTADWSTVSRSADAELSNALRIMRARSRDAVVNDDYAKRYLQLVRTNVIGPNGIQLQVKSRDPDGALDTDANRIIESAWRDWGRLGVCTVDGRMSWIDAQKLFVSSLARDGEVLIRFVYGYPENKYRFALEFLDAELLDETYNDKRRGGPTIRLGVEYNAYGRPAAYHILDDYPSSPWQTSHAGRKPKRYPAEEILHAYEMERSQQGRGIPWTAASLYRLKQLSKYEATELTAARVGASKMGFFIESDVNDSGDATDDDFTPISYAEPGTFDRLPVGTEFQSWDPEHPVSAYENFVLSVLRGAASGLGVSYTSLSNDLRSVSYSSIRQGALDERDNWRAMQTFTCEHFMGPVFSAWLRTALFARALGQLPFRRLDKFDAAVWRPRGWAWVDPLKEAKGHQAAVKSGFKSINDVVAEGGREMTEVFEQLADEKKAAADLGIELDTINTGGSHA